MLEAYKKVLEDAGALDITNLPPAITIIADSVPGIEVPNKMRYTVATSEIVLYAGMLRRNIILWDDTIVPINAISFIISESGSGKDKTAKGIRKCFEEGYNLINEKRRKIAVDKAISIAFDMGEENVTNPSVYGKYYKAPEPLFSSVDSTVKGLHGHFNRLEAEELGAGYITSMEIGSALETKGNIIELIEFISEVFDTGSKEIKLIGNKDEQILPLHSFPVTALFGGSQANLLYSNEIRKKFKVQFSSKLARRSFFNFNLNKVKLPDTLTTPEQVANYKMEANKNAKAIRELVSKNIVDITEYYLNNNIRNNIVVSKEVETLYNIYTEYNKLVAESISSMYPMARLARTHQQWRALKLAGALSLFALNDSITVQDFVWAINYCELMSEDLMMFEIELEKEPYELFSDFIRTEVDSSNKAFMSIHELRKRGYLTASTSKAKLQELATNAASYDTVGIYTVSDSGIYYELPKKTQISGISYKEVSGTKEQRARQSAYGFEYVEVEFADLANVLKGNYAYSPFEFKDGKRSSSTIISGCKWIALDVDDSKITAEEMHFLLQDLNHHIALTSNETNHFKFRLLLELDTFVDVENNVWKYFIKSIAEELSITIDNLPKSQIFFSYGAKEVLSVTNAKPLETRDHILWASSQVTLATPERKLTKEEKKRALDNAMDTFAFAYECETGSGSRNLIKAAYKAHHLGASKEEIIELLEDINNYWVSPMERKRFESTILTVVNRL